MIEQSIIKFYENLTNLLISNDNLILFANMDETRVERDMISEKTVEKIGAKQVPV